LEEAQEFSAIKRGVRTPFPHEIKRKTAPNSSTNSPIRTSTLDLPVSLQTSV